MERQEMGSTLRELREKSKLSVRDVIVKLKELGHDISDKALYSYESGKRAASADMFLALCEIYNCNNVLEVFSGIEVDYSVPTDSEWKIIEEYRFIDTHGKDMVDTVLEKEYSRCVSISKSKITPISEYGANEDNGKKEKLKDLVARSGNVLSKDDMDLLEDILDGLYEDKE